MGWLLTIAVIALYEFIYNFIIWSSLITTDAIKGIVDSGLHKCAIS